MLTAKVLDLTRSVLTGPLRLINARIAGQFICCGATLSGRDDYGNALAAEQLQAGAVILDEGFTAAGVLLFRFADITGGLGCRGGTLTYRDKDGNALIADFMKAGSVFLDQKFTAAGAIRLAGAVITGQLSCRNASLDGCDRDGQALVAFEMKAGSVLLDGGFSAGGTVVLTSAHVDGALVLVPERLTGGDDTAALDAARAHISGQLCWDPDEPVARLVNLEGTTVGELVDRWVRDRAVYGSHDRPFGSHDRSNGHWPAGGHLRLNGFTYTAFGGDEQATVDQRLSWIRGQYRLVRRRRWKFQKLGRRRSQYYQLFGPRRFVVKPLLWLRLQYQEVGRRQWDGFSTQPYEQLAAVYRQAGQDAEARKVAIARRADSRKYGNIRGLALSIPSGSTVLF